MKPEEDNTIPTLNLQGFREGQLAGKEEIIFNEIKEENIIEKEHKHDFFIIILFEKGYGVHNIDSIEYAINHKEVHVLFPDQIHKWTIKNGTVAYQLMIEKQFLEQFAPAFRFSFTNYQNHPVIPLTDQAFDQLLYEFNAIRNELLHENSLNLLISARSAVIAGIVSKEAEFAIQEFKVYQSSPKLARFNWLIDKFYKKQKSIGFYAKELNISANYLNILCKQQLKVPASKLIQQRIAVESKRLLLVTDRSIKEIAYELGFSDHAYFSNFFKNQTGMTPSEFRGKL